MNISTNQNTIFIFTGPSLSHQEAKQILPDACFHAPIQCGDVIKAMRAGAQKIIIIDGYFEQKGAVWHKEIIYALSCGIEVYGASSMGALRAAELHTLGMTGYGKIFELYKNNLIIDDDEVALVHGTIFNQQQEAVCESHTTPMVNIRATVDKAIQEHILTLDQAENLILKLKAQPYYNRSIFNSTEDLNINTWLEKNYLDQKKQDAKDLLQTLASPLAGKTDQRAASLLGTEGDKKNLGLFFNRIFREMIVEPFDYAYDFLNPAEKNLAHLKNTNPALLFILQRIAKTLHLGLDIALFYKKNIKPSEVYDYLFQLKSHSPVSLEIIYQAFYIENKSNKNNTNFKNTRTTQAALRILTTLYAGFLGFLTQEKLSISTHMIQKYADEFRRDNQLISIEATMSWMQENQLNTPEEFEQFICLLAPMSQIIDSHNAHSLGLETSLITHAWLSDAKILLDQGLDQGLDQVVDQGLNQISRISLSTDSKQTIAQ